MRSWLLLAVLVGCGSPHPGTGGDDIVDPDAGPGNGDAMIDSGGGSGDDAADGSMTMTDAPPTPACPTWCAETAPVGTTLLYSVFAVNTGDVFAVGNGGTILRRKNNAWAKMTSGTTQNLRGVWASSSSNVWAVGEGGTFLHFDGNQWSSVTLSPVLDMNAVWGSSASDVWALGSGRVFHYNGTAWSSFTLGGTLLAISGTGPNDVWVVGENLNVRHWTTSWSTQTPGGGTDFYGVVAIGANNVWVSHQQPNAEMVNFTGGTTWVQHSTSSAVFQSLYATGATNIWGVGGMQAGHYTGTTWAISNPLGVTQSLWGVHGSGSDIWVVGSGATILHKN